MSRLFPDEAQKAKAIKKLHFDIIKMLGG